MSTAFWVESKFKKMLAGLNPWLPIFAFVTLFQAIRYSLVDVIYFFIVTIVLIIDWKRWIPLTIPERYQPSTRLIVITSVLFGIAIYAVPRRSALGITLMISLLLIVVGLAWYRDHGPKPALTKAMSRTKYSWLVVGLLLALWELFAYILSDIEGDTSYPTLSVLMAPLLAMDIGRVLFLLVWLSLGIFLVRRDEK